MSPTVDASSLNAKSDALVFFGATGDLAYKMIFPALAALTKAGRLDVPVIGVAKAGWDVDRLRARMRDSLKEHGGVDEKVVTALSSRLRYIDGDYAYPSTFEALRKALGSSAHPLHYLAIPPSTFESVVSGLSRSGAAKGARVVVEKPFGHDLASARKLNETLLSTFPESSVFRIDHFLGKEPVENLLYFRFNNPFLEPIWNRTHIRGVHVTMAESMGVQGRGSLYDATGTIRDVVQNHLLQVIASLAMEAPTHGEPDAVRASRSRLLQSIVPMQREDVVRGQFRGYRYAPGVAKDSQVETFAAVRLFIDSWRWAGVPFYVRAGKQLPIDCTEIFVDLAPPPTQAFAARPSDAASPSYVRFRLSPDVAIAIGILSKVPGEAMVGQPVELVTSPNVARDMSPYERLLGDAMKGDASLFARQDAVEAEWRVVDGVLNDSTPPVPYEPGTWGPSADGLLAPGARWQEPQVSPTRPTPPDTQGDEN